MFTWVSLNKIVCVIGKSACEAADCSLQYMAERVQGGGGAVVVSPTGDWSATFTTERMAWAAFTGEYLHYGLNPNEVFEEKLI